MAERAPLSRQFRRFVIHPLEAAAAVAIYGVFAVLSVDAASNIGGLLGRAIGPLLPVNRRALRNLERAMPELTGAEIAEIVRAMWDNLGRVMAEYPHLERITRDAGNGGRVAITGTEHIAAIRDNDTACILVSGHFSNFELFGLTAREYGIPFAYIYRAANNPIIDRLVRRIRRLSDDDIVPKGAEGARKAIEVLRGGRRLAILVDQKMNDGIAVPFFGRPAMTAPAAAQLGLRFGCPMIPARMERTAGCRFRLSFYPALETPDSGDRHADVQAMMARLNAMLETWIRDRPAEWLWVHNRWPDD
jgi:KDO2-lipid IV(A) lauroyltransferase